MAEDARVAVSLDVSAIPAQAAGAGRYVLELVSGLGRRDGVDLTLVSRRGDTARWRERAPAARLVAPVPGSRPRRLAYERGLLGPYLRKLDSPEVAVHHGPHYTLPGGLGRIRSVVTIHDLTFFDHPEWHERSKVTFFRRAIRRSVSTADGIVCVSATTATRLRDLFDVRVPLSIVPHGVDHDRFRPTTDAAADWALLAPLGIQPKTEMITHLGTLEPRKGVVDLVEAFDLMAPRLPRARLVLAGIPGWGAPDVDAAISRSPNRGRIVKLGFVDDAVVPALLRSSSVVAYPSREEGFGLPALEAMACGATLVTTSGTAMEDFAGPAAWTAAPARPDELAVALEQAATASAAERARRRSVGLSRAAAYRWDDVAAAHLECYLAAARRSSASVG